MKNFKIGDRLIGKGHPVFIVAEMSANHAQSYEKAVNIIKAAADAGVDAIKLQTYKPETITINSNKKWFQLSNNKIWHDKTLYQLYKEAYTPWDWQPKLKDLANQLGLILFSTPFDETAVDFLEEINVPVYKLASFEVVDLPLIEYIAATGKPLIMSTGMATLAEIDEAVSTFYRNGGQELALLHCISSYPAVPANMNLVTLSSLSKIFQVPSGLSDHSLSDVVVITAVALGASIIEKHFTLSHNDPGPDSAFSLDPGELKKLVNSVRMVEQALGQVKYGVRESELENQNYRRSIFVVKDVIAGEVFTTSNLRIIRPGYGLSPRFYKTVLGMHAGRNIESGSPFVWKFLQEENK